MQQINSPEFERWAKIFNLKEMAKTVMYLQENGLTDLGELEKACDAAVQKFNDLADQMKAADARMKDISELQRHIGTYSKAREVYAQYRKLTGRKQAKFYEQHTSEIEGCQAAKRYFDSHGLKKLPSIQSLKAVMIFLSLRVTADAGGDLKGPAQLRRSLQGFGGGQPPTSTPRYILRHCLPLLLFGHHQEK